MSPVAISQRMQDDVAAVRRMHAALRGARAKLRGYADEVLHAAIRAEIAAQDFRPMFVRMLEAELRRRAKVTP